MKALFDLLTSPFGLPINILYEYVILAFVGLIAFRLAYYLAGRFGMDSEERRFLHWFFRFIIFVALWAVVRIIIWLYRNPLYAAIIFGTIGLLAVVIITIKMVKRRKQK